LIGRSVRFSESTLATVFDINQIFWFEPDWVIGGRMSAVTQSDETTQPCELALERAALAVRDRRAGQLVERFPTPPIGEVRRPRRSWSRLTRWK
jgi:hypothetical protein